MAIENDPNLIGSVAAWQHILNGNGYQPPLNINGALDAVTKETTKKFQKDVGLPVTGAVDLKTWQVGLKHPKLRGWSVETPPIGTSASATPAKGKVENNPKTVGSLAAWQNILNGNGYQPPLRITGGLDEATKDTTKRFQKDVGLPVTGTVDVKTWAAGLKHPKIRNWSDETPPLGGKVFVSKSQAEYIFENPISNVLLTDLNLCLEKFEIYTVPRIRHFLAQVAHESGGLRWLRELGGPEYFSRLYQGRQDLGNFNPGDGVLFAGAGAIQLTGRYNYEAFSTFIGDSRVVSQGQSYVADKYPFTSAGFWWMNNGINDLVDSGASVDRVGARVNGAYLPNGYEDRRYYYGLASRVIV